MIIGIAGRAGAGKSTIAEMLVKALGGGTHVKIIPFAKPLKEFARKLGWDGNKDAKGRRLLQLLGTDVGRECIDEDIWVKHWCSLCDDALRDGYNHILVDDMRFPNEIAAVLSRGGIVLQVAGRGYDNIDTSHPSEQTLVHDSFTKIDNSGDTQDLEKKIQDLCHSFT